MADFNATVTPHAQFLQLEVSGTFASDTYGAFAARLEDLLDEHAPTRLLFVMTDRHGWASPHLWKDTTFKARPRPNIERVALVGERSWRHWLTQAGGPFMNAQLQFFDADQLEDARAWPDGADDPRQEQPTAMLPDKVSAALQKLGGSDGNAREVARHKLARMGPEVVPALAEAARNGSWQVRWEATKALTEIHHESTIPYLVAALHEGDDIRWIAAERLRHLGPSAIEAILRDLISHANSIGLCRGAHIVLDRRDDPKLREQVAPVVKALEDFDPSLSVPIAADAVLRRLTDRNIRTALGRTA